MCALASHINNKNKELKFCLVHLTILRTIGHWNSLHYKVSQGGAREACMNFFQVYWQKIDKCISIIISISVVSFINFDASFVTLFRVKVIKNAPNHEIV